MDSDLQWYMATHPDQPNDDATARRRVRHLKLPHKNMTLCRMKIAGPASEYSNRRKCKNCLRILEDSKKKTAVNVPPPSSGHIYHSDKYYEAMERNVRFLVGLEKDTWFCKGFVVGVLLSCAFWILFSYFVK